MRGFYSISSRVRGLKPVRDTAELPDPYSPQAGDYEERTRETVAEIAPGMFRIDIGTPLDGTAATPLQAPSVIPNATIETPLPVVPVPSHKERSWKDDYGVTRDP